MTTFDIPSRLNIHLGVSRIEFHSLTAEDIQQLEAEKKEQQKRALIDNLIKDKEEESLINRLVRGVNDVIDRIAGYLALSICVFLLVLYVRARMSKEDEPK